MSDTNNNPIIPAFTGPVADNGGDNGSYDNSSYQSGALIRRQRVIADMYMPDCAIQEVHHDTLTITEHPVEVGAAITDHAFKNPSEVTVQYGWSNSAQGNDTNSETYDQDVYNTLLMLQASRQPFDLITGKRSYANMLIAELSVTVDETSEYTLMTNMVLKQIILVSTSVSVSPANQSDPQTTQPTVNRGQQSPKLQNNPPANVINV